MFSTGKKWRKHAVTGSGGGIEIADMAAEVSRRDGEL